MPGPHVAYWQSAVLIQAWGSLGVLVMQKLVWSDFRILVLNYEREGVTSNHEPCHNCTLINYITRLLYKPLKGV